MFPLWAFPLRQEDFMKTLAPARPHPHGLPALRQEDFMKTLAPV
jgi:hypothetical protein